MYLVHASTALRRRIQDTCESHAWGVDAVDGSTEPVWKGKRFINLHDVLALLDCKLGIVHFRCTFARSVLFVQNCAMNLSRRSRVGVPPHTIAVDFTYSHRRRETDQRRSYHHLRNRRTVPPTSPTHWGHTGHTQPHNPTYQTHSVDHYLHQNYPDLTEDDTMGCMRSLFVDQWAPHDAVKTFHATHLSPWLELDVHQATRNQTPKPTPYPSQYLDPFQYSHYAVTEHFSAYREFESLMELFSVH